MSSYDDRMSDPYQILGVAITATESELKAAWKQAARDSHPDLHPTDLTAPQRFNAARDAYDLLSDPRRRADLDRGRAMRSQYGEPAPAPAKPTRERERSPSWWDDMFGPGNAPAAPVHVRPAPYYNPYYHEEQRDLEQAVGSRFAWTRSGTYTGAPRKPNPFRSKFRNGGKIG